MLLRFMELCWTPVNLVKFKRISSFGSEFRKLRRFHIVFYGMRSEKGRHVVWRADNRTYKPVETAGRSSEQRGSEEIRMNEWSFGSNVGKGNGANLSELGSSGKRRRVDTGCCFDTVGRASFR